MNDRPTLYYAIGGGLGHVTRARRVLDTLGLREEAAIVTASETALDPRVNGGMPVILVPAALESSRDAHRAWLASLLRSHSVARLIIDTFPAGIRGELTGLEELAEVRLDYVGRLLRWSVYLETLSDAPSLRYETTYLVEELTDDHATFIESQSANVMVLDLAAALTKECENAQSPERQEPFWLLVHSGPADEVHELIAHVEELRKFEHDPPPVIVATLCDVAMPQGFERLDLDPAAAWFPSAARLFSAAGCNVMLETERWRDKHTVIPFARRFDDQYLRAARRRARQSAAIEHQPAQRRS